MVGNCQRDDLSVLRAESRTVDLEVAPGRDGAADTALCARRACHSRDVVVGIQRAVTAGVRR